jgi:hypothetical protein
MGVDMGTELDDDAGLDNEQTAEILGIGPQSLAWWRMQGQGAEIPQSRAMRGIHRTLYSGISGSLRGHVR